MLFCFSMKNGLLTFCKIYMFRKFPALKYWFENLKTSQNLGFFKLQYCTNKLRY